MYFYPIKTSNDIGAKVRNTRPFNPSVLYHEISCPTNDLAGPYDIKLDITIHFISIDSLNDSSIIGYHRHSGFSALPYFRKESGFSGFRAAYQSNCPPASAGLLRS